MSHPGDATGNASSSSSHKPPPPAATPVAGFAARFSSALVTSDRDKPDSKRYDFGSPVSPLVNAWATAATTNNTSSSSGSSGSVAGRAGSSVAGPYPNASPARTPPDGAVGANRSHSGELVLSRESSPTNAAVDWTGSGGARRNPNAPGHRRSCSGPLIYSSSYSSAASGSGAGAVSGGGGGSVSSPPMNVLPAGNICPSGKIGKAGMMTARSTARNDVLGRGTGNYGHGSVVRGSGGGGTAAVARSSSDIPPTTGNTDWVTSAARRAMAGADPEELKRMGNEMYKKGQYGDALRLYDRAIGLCPDNAACRSNRAAALMAMGQLGEAVKECEAAIRSDPTYGRARQRLVSLYLRTGQIDNARKHLPYIRELLDPVELQKLQAIERHLSRCADARRIEDWKSALRESDAAISAGADSSPLIIASKAEALLRLHLLDEADSSLLEASKLDVLNPSSSQTKFFGMMSDSYFYIIKAQIEMAFGRFENAEKAAKKAQELDPHHKEVAKVSSNSKSVARARVLGNDLFKAGKYSDACAAYGEGLKLDPSNPVLFCNRAVCHSKMEQWQRSVDDCNEALRIQPNYTKALRRRAASYGKLERWAESVRDYEILRKELPEDNEIAEALFHAQVAWKASRGEAVSNMKFGGEVEKIMGIEQFNAEISLPGVSVVHFMSLKNKQCLQISSFVDILSNRYPSINFLKLDVDEYPLIAKVENVRVLSTIKIYKNGLRMKEMICPSSQILENSVRHYGL